MKKLLIVLLAAASTAAYGRYYDPQTARFLTKDPAALLSGDTNPYRYVMNDPVNRVDPTGLWDVVLSFGVASGASSTPGGDTGHIATSSYGLAFGYNNGSIDFGKVVLNQGTGTQVQGIVGAGGFAVSIVPGDLNSINGPGSASQVVLGPASYGKSYDASGNVVSYDVGLPAGKGFGLGSYTTTNNTTVMSCPRGG